MKRTVRVLVLSSLMLLASPAAFSAAFAASYLDEAVQALQDANVYASPLVAGIDSSTLTNLEQQASEANIGIAILPAEAADETGGNTAEFVNEVASQTGFDTVVVAFGSDLVAGSYTLPGVAGQIADQAEAANDSTGEALTDFIAEVSAEQPQPTGSSESSGGIPVGMGIGIAVAILLGLAVGVFNWRRYKKRREAIAARAEPELDPETREALEKQQQLDAALERMLMLRSRITSGSDSIGREIQANLLEGMNQTRALVDKIRATRSDMLVDKLQEYLDDAVQVNEILEMYIEAQDSEVLFSSPEEANEIKQDTRRVAEAYRDTLHQNLGIVSVDRMIKFKAAAAMLTAHRRPDGSADIPDKEV